MKGDSAKVQIGAELRCKGGKVSAAGGREITEYRVRITERGRSPRIEAARLARSANPTRYNMKRGTGSRDICKRPESSLNHLSANH